MVNIAKALIGASAVVSTANAFPALVDGDWQKYDFSNFDQAIEPILKRIDQESWDKIAAIDKRQQTSFNEEAQRVDVSGEHEYRAPTEGECVGSTTTFTTLLTLYEYRPNSRSLSWSQHPL